MPKSSTPSFITEIPIKTGSAEEAILKKRFWAAKQQYNALLGEALKRLQKMRKDTRYSKAKELYKQEGKKKEAKALFKEVAELLAEKGAHLHVKDKQEKTPLDIAVEKNHQTICSVLERKICF